jgi:hypothetical protein
MLTALQVSQRICRVFAYAFVNLLRVDLQNFVSQYSFRETLLTTVSTRCLCLVSVHNLLRR